MPLDYVLGDPVDQQKGGFLVRLADNALKSVAFIGPISKETGEPTYSATGFFVKYVSKEGGDTYFVTARHVADRISGKEFILRMGDAKEVIRAARWYVADDGTADVAITPYRPPSDAGVVRFHIKHFLTEFKVGSKRIGPGDQVHVVGLYNLHPGETKNRIAVHTGHIAMMPDRDECFTINNWPHPVEGYAVEAQTLEGLSGSPVYVRRSIQVSPTERSGTPPLAYGAVFLLGLWMASWKGIPDIELPTAADKKDQGAAKNRSEDSKPTLVPAGMGVVVPAYHIIDAMNCEELCEMRRKEKEEKQSENAATLDAEGSSTRGSA